ncbi:MAG TPA: hypothetical protein VHD37_01220 [Candidatus Paceibacterota bacterium]|nr:hypothetical protein [Candidatus Paceibacterota bacterium]
MPSYDYRRAPRRRINTAQLGVIITGVAIFILFGAAALWSKVHPDPPPAVSSSVKPSAG